MKAGDLIAKVTEKLGIQKCAGCAQRQRQFNEAHDRLVSALQELLGEDTVEIDGWTAEPRSSNGIDGVAWLVVVKSPLGGFSLYPDDILREKPHRKVVEYFLKEAMRGREAKEDSRSEERGTPSRASGGQEAT